MKLQTRKMLLNLAASVAILAAGAVVLLPAAVSAAPATATDTVNIRDAPSGNVVGKLRAGETVDVGQCAGGWCYITHPGPDGWVSNQFLGQPGKPGVSFGFSINSNGQPSVSIGVGNNPPPRPGRPPVVDDEEDDASGDVCFYDRSRMRGDSFCMSEGDSIRDLRGWSDRISSIDNEDGFDVTVCTRTNFRGTCRTYTSSARTISGIDDDISSIEIE